MAWGNPALCRVGGATWGLVGGAVPISRHCSLRRHLARGGRAKLKCIFLASAAVMKEKVHKDGDHEQCQEETENRPAVAHLRSDWGSVTCVHNILDGRGLRLRRAG